MHFATYRKMLSQIGHRALLGVLVLFSLVLLFCYCEHPLSYTNCSGIFVWGCQLRVYGRVNPCVLPPSAFGSVVPAAFRVSHSPAYIKIASLQALQTHLCQALFRLPFPLHSLRAHSCARGRHGCELWEGTLSFPVATDHCGIFLKKIIQ